MLTQIARKIPLRLLLTLVVVLIILATTITAAWISYQTGQQMAMDLTMTLRDQAADQVTQHLQNYLATAHQVNAVGLAALQNGLITPDQPDAMANFFWNQARVYAGLSTVAYATTEGRYRGANYLESYVVLADVATDGVIRRYEVDDQGWRTNTVLVERGGYDPRSRAWYQTAIEAPSSPAQPAWAGISASATGPRLDLTAVQAAYDSSQTLLGVFMVDISLANLGEYLAALESEERYEVMIIDQDGYLVATSINERPFVIDQSGVVTRLAAQESSNFLVAACVAAFQEGRLAGQNELTALNLVDPDATSSETQRYYLSVNHFSDPGGLEWDILIAMPESIVQARTQLANRLSLTLIVISGVLAALLGWGIATWISRPIVEINQAAQKIAQSHWESSPDLNRQNEIGQLARAFTYLQERLARSAQDLQQMADERHRVENQIRKERELFYRIMDSTLIGVLEYEHDQSISFANNRAIQILRLERADEGHYAIPQHMVYDMKGQLLSNKEYPVAQVVETLLAVSGARLTLQWPDRQRTHVLMNASPVFGEWGRLESIVMTVEDITDRYAAEAALHESETRFRTLVRNLSVGVLVYGSQGEVLLMNVAGYEILGMNSEKIPGDVRPKGENVFIDENGKTLTDSEMPVNIVLQTGQQVRNQVVGLVHPQRRRITWLQIDALPQHTSDGSLSNVLCVITDITTRRRAEDWLRTVVAGIAGVFGQSFFESLVKHLAIALEAQYAYVGELDRPGHVRVLAFWSGNDFGTPFEYDLDGTPCEEVLKQDVCLHLQGVQDLFPSDTGLRQLGVESYMGVPLFDSAHNRMGLLVVMDNRPMPDVQERRSILTIFGARAGGEMERMRDEQQIMKLNAELEERVARRTHQLELANSELEAFTYSVSHDLRAPLRNIEGFSRILQEDYSHLIGEEGQLYVERILIATKRMNEMTESLLKLSRLNQAELRVEEVDLSQVAITICTELSEAQPNRKVVWEVKPQMVVHGNPKLLEIAMYNLLLNAWKFTSQKSAAHVEVGQEVVGSERIYFVRDNGVGFDMTYATHLFSPFQRLHSASDFEGIGIGLATVKRIISRHGGRIWASSAPDSGATFHFVLPSPQNLLERSGS
jgi:PAS domain S-box-containing protein